MCGSGVSTVILSVLISYHRMEQVASGNDEIMIKCWVRIEQTAPLLLPEQRRGGSRYITRGKVCNYLVEDS